MVCVLPVPAVVVCRFIREILASHRNRRHDPTTLSPAFNKQTRTRLPVGEAGAGEAVQDLLDHGRHRGLEHVLLLCELRKAGVVTERLGRLLDPGACGVGCGFEHQSGSVSIGLIDRLNLHAACVRARTVADLDEPLLRVARDDGHEAPLLLVHADGAAADGNLGVCGNGMNGVGGGWGHAYRASPSPSVPVPATISIEVGATTSQPTHLDVGCPLHRPHASLRVLVDEWVDERSDQNRLLQQGGVGHVITLDAWVCVGRKRLHFDQSKTCQPLKEVHKR